MTTVFVSGCFQYLHRGHTEHLRWARSLGDRLVVSVAADETILAYKGRLLQPAEDRRFVLSALRCVDKAVIAPVETERPWADCLPLLAEYRPQIWALGPDDPHERDKAQAAGWLGIDVVRQPGPKPYSTTALVERARAFDVHREAARFGGYTADPTPVPPTVPRGGSAVSFPRR
jgi:cytidyltransferase-like protein